MFVGSTQSDGRGKFRLRKALWLRGVGRYVVIACQRGCRAKAGAALRRDGTRWVRIFLGTDGFCKARPRRVCCVAWGSDAEPRGSPVISSASRTRNVA
jgi:hypothetical protein